ncbi:MAG: hypothetical protein AAFV53_37770 [Myxococcota bacterium]
MRAVLFPALVLFSACTDEEDDTSEESQPILAELSPERFGNWEDGLDVPRDLEFNPLVDGELWVVNRTDDSVSIFFDAGTEQQTSEHIVDSFALHFMEEVSSMAFGAVTWEGSDSPTFGTCQESRNTYNDQAPPNDFMGPALWTADLDYFGLPNPEAIEFLGGADLGSHLDMLHESPLCMGMAWDEENVYWVFDGSAGNIVRYDFAEDHGLGYDDHSDGDIARYVEAEVERVEDVPSHMVIDQSTKLLYIVDTGNNQITVLDTASGDFGEPLRSIEPGTAHYTVEGIDYSTLIDGSEIEGMDVPSGIALVDDRLLITDNQSNTIFLFDLQGNLLEERTFSNLEPGAMMGIEARALDDIWFVDAVDNRLFNLR